MFVVNRMRTLQTRCAHGAPRPSRNLHPPRTKAENDRDCTNLGTARAVFNRRKYLLTPRDLIRHYIRQGACAKAHRRIKKRRLKLFMPGERERPALSRDLHFIVRRFCPRCGIIACWMHRADAISLEIAVNPAAGLFFGFPRLALVGRTRPGVGREGKERVRYHQR